MNAIKNTDNEEDKFIKSYENFWRWFVKNEKKFYKVVKENGNIEEVFFNKLSPKLEEIKEGFFFLTGMLDDNTVELVFTPDGNLKNLVFVEELVNAAPTLSNWKFTALKPAMDIEGFSIKMAGHEFSKENMSFYSNEYTDYPDEIDITIIHEDFTEENKSEITNGVYIFLDNYLGELDSITTIDYSKVKGKNEAQKELIPIQKLKEFLVWRQKEFIEKYEETRYNTDEDSYSMLEAELPDGNPLIAVINSDLLEWDGKASHPWILNIELKYNSKEYSGMPDKETYQLLDEIEANILAELKDFEGFLNIGRQTAESVREIYFACKDFRKPSKVLHKIQEKYAATMEIEFDIYKDKYWQSFNRFLEK